MLRSLCHPNIVRLIEVIGAASAAPCISSLIAIGPFGEISQRARMRQTSCECCAPSALIHVHPMPSLTLPPKEPVLWCLEHDR